MKRLVPILFWLMLGGMVVVSFRIDWVNNAQGGAIDLRNRITGFRLLEHRISPYYYKWHEVPRPNFATRATISKGR